MAGAAHRRGKLWMQEMQGHADEVAQRRPSACLGGAEEARQTSFQQQFMANLGSVVRDAALISAEAAEQQADAEFLGNRQHRRFPRSTGEHGVGAERLDEGGGGVGLMMYAQVEAVRYALHGVVLSLVLFGHRRSWRRRGQLSKRNRRRATIALELAHCERGYGGGIQAAAQLDPHRAVDQAIAHSLIEEFDRFLERLRIGSRTSLGQSLRPPMAVQSNFAAGEDEAVARWEPVYCTEERACAAGLGDAQQRFGDRDLVEIIGYFRHRKQRFDGAAEDQALLAERVVEGAHSHRVAREEQLAAALLVYREGEVAEETIRAVAPPTLEGAEHQLRVVDFVAPGRRQAEGVGQLAAVVQARVHCDGKAGAGIHAHGEALANAVGGASLAHGDVAIRPRRGGVAVNAQRLQHGRQVVRQHVARRGESANGAHGRLTAREPTRRALALPVGDIGGVAKTSVGRAVKGGTSQERLRVFQIAEAQHGCPVCRNQRFHLRRGQNAAPSAGATSAEEGEGGRVLFSEAEAFLLAAQTLERGVLDALRQLFLVSRQPSEAHDGRESREGIGQHVFIAHDMHWQFGLLNPACHVAAPCGKPLLKHDVRPVVQLELRSLGVVHQAHRVVNAETMMMGVRDCDVQRIAHHVDHAAGSRGGEQAWGVFFGPDATPSIVGLDEQGRWQCVGKFLLEPRAKSLHHASRHFRRVEPQVVLEVFPIVREGFANQGIDGRRPGLCTHVVGEHGPQPRVARLGIGDQPANRHCDLSQQQCRRWHRRAGTRRCGSPECRAAAARRGS